MLEVNHMITKITIGLNGGVAPNKLFTLGYKYENVGDILEFTIPERYRECHIYLALHMEKHDAIVLPLNKVDDAFQFIISSTVTQYPGTYEMILLATGEPIEDSDINNANVVFVSNTMSGIVIDNFLEDPLGPEELEPNLKIVYEELLTLRDTLQQALEEGVFIGPYYKPSVDGDGVLEWSISKDKDMTIPDPVNLTGPEGAQGPYYLPEMEDGVLGWTQSQEDMPTIEGTDLKPLIKTASDAYLDENLEAVVETKVDAKFKYTWNATTQTLYIETEDIETIPQDVEGVEF